MWYPCPVYLPIMSPQLPRPSPPLSIDGHRTFILNRSVFDLIKMTHGVALTDPKLLGWYLSLPVEDREVIQARGGLLRFLQRHPALEVSMSHVFVKQQGSSWIPPQATNQLQNSRRPMLNCVTECLNCGSCWTSGGKKCRCCEAPLQIEVSSADQPGFPPILEQFPEIAFAAGPIGQESEIGLHPDNVEEGLLPNNVEEFALLSCAGGSGGGGGGVSQTALEQVLGGPQTLDPTPPVVQSACDVSSHQRGAEGGHAALLQGQSSRTGVSDWMNAVGDCLANRAEKEEVWMCERESKEDDYHTVMEQDRSIVMYRRASEERQPADSLRPSGSLSEATGAGGAPGPGPAHTRVTADRSTNTLPSAPTRDVGVGPEPGLAGGKQHIQTQTQGPATADKNVNTQVFMADLDYVVEKFMEMKSAEEELKELKVKMSGSAAARTDGERGCACGQRDQRAELCLLALQYAMCQQHCWRRFYTSPEGDRLVQGTDGPPQNLQKVLQVLEADYKEMRGKVQAGVPLDQLEPLAVDSQKVTSTTLYIPAQITGDSLIVSSGVSEKASQQAAGGGDINPPDRIGRKDSQEGPREGGPVCLPQAESSRPGQVVPLPQQTGTGRGPRPGGGMEPSSSETWYDADEDLAPAGAAGKVEEDGGGGAIQGRDEYRISFRGVTDLPGYVTETLDISRLDMVGAGREANKKKTLEPEAGEREAREEAVVENALPDYAAGLVSTQPEELVKGLAGAASPGQLKQRSPVFVFTASPAAPPSPGRPPSSQQLPETPAQPPGTATPTPQQRQPRKNLLLTREQMYAAQEMFKTANKVTRAEKTLILGFMAGSRENPCPEQGDVVQIKLSEHTELLPKAAGAGSTTMLLDTVLEMNYSTGHWTYLKKYRPETSAS